MEATPVLDESSIRRYLTRVVIVSFLFSSGAARYKLSIWQAICANVIYDSHHPYSVHISRTIQGSHGLGRPLEIPWLD